MWIFQGASESVGNPGFSTIALVAVTDNIPLSAITHELVHCLNIIG